jgi:oligopeptide transport system substrate-binding protein
VQRLPCPAGQSAWSRQRTDPLSLDPQVANLVTESRVIGDLMVGLTTEAPDGKAILAWRVREASADGLTWTFHLRQHLWSDGTPVTARDFVFAWQRLLDPKTAANYAYNLWVLRNAQRISEGKLPPSALGVSAPDDGTLVLQLEHPAPYMPQLMMHQSFYPVPKHVVEKLGEGWVKPGNYVSNGAYRLAPGSWATTELDKNPRFRTPPMSAWTASTTTPPPTWSRPSGGCSAAS